MDDTIIKVALGIVVSSIISILGTLAAKSRSEGRDEQRLIDLAKGQGALEAKCEKLAVDLNRLGGKVREIYVVLGIAGQTGEVPKFPMRDSGEGRAIP